MLRRVRGGGSLAVAAALLAAVAGCRGDGGTPEAPPPPVVGVAEVRRMDVPLKAEPNGTTRALSEVSIRARVRGFLKEVHFDEGADVEAGQLLFVIEEDPFQAALDAAGARQAEAEASLEKARSSKGREIAAAQLTIDQALLALARVESIRQQKLAARSAASQEDFDRAEAERQRYDAQVQSDRAQLEQANSDYEINILAAQANVDAAKAAVRDAEINLGYCRMTSPIKGRIGEAKVKVGNLVGPGSAGGEYTELATVQQLDPMGVDIQASSRYLARATELIRNGLEVRLVRPGFEGEQNHPYPGSAFFIDNRVDPTTSTFLVKARVPNPDASLLPGEYVKVDLTVGNLPGALVVPERAVMQAQGERQMVYVVDAEEVVRIALVTATTTYQGLRVITEGLELGQVVVVDGLQLVRPGMTVRTEPVAAGPEPEPRGGGAPVAASGP